uniref:Uncharacterized protein n=1 Tax=Oryza sativa subsp. japonica TaxID=39947 RepID=Q6ZF05_ORYSJ|nr:hypothetical protein [Oryza sativa Japonica Group]
MHWVHHGSSRNDSPSSHLMHAIASCSSSLFRKGIHYCMFGFLENAVWSHMVHALHCTQFFVGWKNMTGFKVHQENPDSELSSYLMLDMVKCSYIN